MHYYNIMLYTLSIINIFINLGKSDNIFKLFCNTLDNTSICKQYFNEK